MLRAVGDAALENAKSKPRGLASAQDEASSSAQNAAISSAEEANTCCVEATQQLLESVVTDSVVAEQGVGSTVSGTPILHATGIAKWPAV